MATNDTKRFYWLKLHKDFFKQHEIRIVEGMPNGKDYVLFYLKLLVESVSHEGDLRFSDTVPYNEQMLSILTDTNIDVVRSAMKIFTDLKMIEVLDDATIHMVEVQKLIGSETGAAQRMRVVRNNREQCSQIGEQNGNNVAKRLEIRDKSIDSGSGGSSDTEKVNLDCKNKYLINTDSSNNQLDINNKTTATTTEKIFNSYQRNLGAVTPIIGEKLQYLTAEVGEVKVLEAIAEAAAMNVHNFKYVEAVAKGRGGKPKPKGYQSKNSTHPEDIITLNPDCPECHGTGEAVRYIDGRTDMPVKIDCPICCGH